MQLHSPAEPTELNQRVLEGYKTEIYTALHEAGIHLWGNPLNAPDRGAGKTALAKARNAMKAFINLEQRLEIADEDKSIRLSEQAWRIIMKQPNPRFDLSVGKYMLAFRLLESRVLVYLAHPGRKTCLGTYRHLESDFIVTHEFADDYELQYIAEAFRTLEGVVINNPGLDVRTLKL